MPDLTPAQAAAYDQWYDEPLGRQVGPLEKAALFSLLPPLKGRLVLEGGCGTGYFTLPLAEQGATLVASDLSGAMLARARDKAEGYGDRIAWVQADLCYLPFSGEKFDMVAAILVLDFVADREAAVREMARVLRPGGFLVLAVLNLFSLWCLGWKVKALVQPSRWKSAPFLSEAEWRRLLERVGAFGQFEWRRAVYGPPWQHPWLARLTPWWERLGKRLMPGAGAFLVVKARRSRDGINL